MLIGALILGLVALIPALLTKPGPNPEYSLYHFLSVVDCRNFVHFPYWVRMGAFLVIIFGLGMNELITTGILGMEYFSSWL